MEEKDYFSKVCEALTGCLLSVSNNSMGGERGIPTQMEFITCLYI
jgi:hypothetical protein